MTKLFVFKAFCMYFRIASKDKKPVYNITLFGDYCPEEVFLLLSILNSTYIN